MLVGRREVRKLLVELHSLKGNFGAFAASRQVRAVRVENDKVVPGSEGGQVGEVIDAVEACRCRFEFRQPGIARLALLLKTGWLRKGSFAGYAVFKFAVKFGIEPPLLCPNRKTLPRPNRPVAWILSSFESWPICTA